MGSSCRVLQFAAYTYDVSIMDIFTILMQVAVSASPARMTTALILQSS